VAQLQEFKVIVTGKTFTVEGKVYIPQVMK
jgi:hypothetical protein